MKKILLFTLIALLCASFFGCTGESLPSSDSGSSNSGDNLGTAPEWVGKTFGYSWEKDTSLNLFVEWIKSGGTKEIRGVRYDQYSYNQPFLDWAKGHEDILLPVVKNDEFRFFSVKVQPDAITYKFNYSTHLPDTKSHEFTQTFDISFTYLSEEQRQRGLYDMLIEKGYEKEILQRGENE